MVLCWLSKARGVLSGVYKLLSAEILLSCNNNLKWSILLDAVSLSQLVGALLAYGPSVNVYNVRLMEFIPYTKLMLSTLGNDLDSSAYRLYRKMTSTYTKEERVSTAMYLI